jgi:hypothetical protein
MIKYHKRESGRSIAEVLTGTQTIGNADDLLDLMADAGYNGCSGLIIHKTTLCPDFFDLKTGLAGEILQKFSNYRMKLAIIGDFSEIKSNSLRDFIRESNQRCIINFVDSFDAGILILDK